MVDFHSSSTRAPTQMSTHAKTMRAIAEGQAVYETVITREDESFLWRLDDYPNSFSKWNYHPECEIHLITNASGTMFVGDYIGKFEPGDLMLIGSGLPHDWVSDVGPGERILGRDVVLQFHPDHIVGAAKYLPELNEITELLTTSERGLRFFGQTAREGAQLLESLGQCTGIDRLVGLINLLRLFTKSTEKEILSTIEFEHVEDEEQVTRMQKATKYIHDHLTEDLNIGTIADLVGMTKSTFSRFFLKNSGHSFTSYIRNLRLGRACRLLSETAKPITEVSFEAGYANLSNFNRIFRAEIKMTPKEYRRAARAKWNMDRRAAASK